MPPAIPFRPLRDVSWIVEPAGGVSHGLFEGEQGRLGDVDLVHRGRIARGRRILLPWRRHYVDRDRICPDGYARHSIRCHTRDHGSAATALILCDLTGAGTQRGSRGRMHGAETGSVCARRARGRIPAGVDGNTCARVLARSRRERHPARTASLGHLGKCLGTRLREPRVSASAISLCRGNSPAHADRSATAGSRFSISPSSFGRATGRRDHHHLVIPLAGPGCPRHPKRCPPGAATGH